MSTDGAKAANVANVANVEVKYHREPAAPGNRPQRFLDALAAILRHSNYRFVLDQFVRARARCGRCGVECPIYEATGRAEDLPCHRSDLLLRVYRRHFTPEGRLEARLLGSPALTDADIDVMAEAFYRCTACRRCNLECPMGLDHGILTHLARWVLSEIGVVPKALQVSVREQLAGKTGNTSGIPAHALLDTLSFLEEELKEQFPAHDIKFPVDVEGAEYVFFPAVSDYLLEPDTLMGQAAVFHVTKDTWTIGTGYFDGINYGLFYNDRYLEDIVRKELAEVRRLKGKKMLIGECGHASRTAKFFVPTYGQPDPPPVVSILEYTADAIRRGKVKLKRDVVKDKVTYHDPCNMARSGWIVDQPREILRTFIADYVDMTPRGKSNYCCGGGAGTVSIDEMRKFRTSIGGKRKAEQLRATGARYVVAPCANCKKQLREVIEDHKLDMEVIGLHDLVLKAIEI